MTGAMNARPIHAVLVLTLILAGAVSAALMSPDRDAAARTASLAALGAASSDLCLASEGAADHRCPFCHLLPDPPWIRAAQAVALVLPGAEVPSSADLVHGPRALRGDRPVRAPPVRI